MGALGTTTNPSQPPLFNPFQLAYLGPYHPDYLMQLYSMPSDALPLLERRVFRDRRWPQSALHQEKTHEYRLDLVVGLAFEAFLDGVSI